MNTNSDNLDGYGSADLHIRHALRIENSHLPSEQERQKWAKVAADRQAAATTSPRACISGIKFGKY